MRRELLHRPSGLPRPALRRRRRGSAMVLFVFMLVVFVIMAALTIDYAYMQMARTELRAAADAAAKAGAEALARTEDENEARSAAVACAAMNRVAGDPLRIDESDVVVGRLRYDPVARWQFQPEGFPPNAVRVEARTGGGALHPAIRLFFGGVHGRPTVSPAYFATAGQQEVEVCLCLDRSGSMLFDMSGKDYHYPPNNPKLLSNAEWNAVRNFFPASQWNTWRNHLSPPHPTASRWAVLDRAIDLFLDEAGFYIPPPRTSLVTWASDYTMPCPPRTVFQAVTTNVPLPAPEEHSWEDNRAAIQAAVAQLGNQPMMGATNLSAGLDRAVAVLTGANAKSFANKVIILLTDGEWNAGRNPIESAYDARDAGIVVHVVMMLTTDQPDVRQIAEITGGRYYVTNSEAELRAAFQELARSLPVVLTE